MPFPTDRPDQMISAIQAGIRMQIEEIAAEETERAVARVKERVAGALDAMTIKMLGHFEISQMGTTITIKVDKRELAR